MTARFEWPPGRRPDFSPESRRPDFPPPGQRPDCPSSDRKPDGERAKLASGASHWNQADLAGRLTELCGWHGSPLLSFALALVLDAQRSGESAAWITPQASSFFPPDAVENGVDLDALLVVRVPRRADVAIAADILARSGSYGLIVLDLGAVPDVSLGALSRLAGLARAHDAAIVFLTEKPSTHASLGSLISLRADATFALRAPGVFACELTVAKDRRHPSAWRHTEVRRGPDGVC